MYLKKWLRRLSQRLALLSAPDDVELVLRLILCTASLELSKDQFVELAPIAGTCGPFKLTGNSLPIFEYRVFEKEIMEFIRVKVEISRPERIQYFSYIDSTTAPELHGKLIETQDKYKAPFIKLMHHLFFYFSIYHKRGVQRESESA